MDLTSLPKIELHLHLDCSMSYELVQKLNPLISRRTFNAEFIAPSKCKNLADYLTRATKQIELLQSEEELSLTTEDLVRQLVEDHVVYAEIRFSPLLHTQGSLDGRQVVEIVSRAAQEAAASAPIEVGIILCTLRQFTEEQSMQTARLAEVCKDSGVVGLDIAGDESGYSLDNHVKAFQYAKEKGINRTAHAGEACGPASVRRTMELLEPTRLGHGVRSLSDPKLSQMLKEQDIHFEVCPTSNIQTDVFTDYEDHNINNLVEKGFSVGVNTDAKTISNVTLSQEYEKLQRTFGWGLRELLKCNLDTLNAAFCEDHKKESTRDKLKKAYTT